MKRCLACLLILISAGLWANPADSLLEGQLRRGLQLRQGHNYKEAVKVLEQAIGRYEEQCSDTALAEVYHQLGVSYFIWGADDEKAYQYTQKAIALRIPALGARHPLVANGYYNKAMIHQVNGRLAAAEEDFNAAIQAIEGNQLLEAQQTDSILAGWYLQVAWLNRELADYARAMRYGKRSLSLAEGRWAGPHEARGDALLHLGNIYFSQGRPEEAARYYRRAAGQYEQLKGEAAQKGAASVLNNLGIVSLELGRWKEAEAALNHAYALHEGLYQSTGRLAFLEKNVNVCSNLMLLHIRAGAPAAAEASFGRAQRLARKAFPSGKHPLIGELYYHKALLEQQQQKAGAALQSCRKALGVMAPGFREGQPAPPASRLYGPRREILKVLALQATLWEEQQPERAYHQYLLIDTLLARMRQSYDNTLSRHFLVQQALPVYEGAIALCRRLYYSTKNIAYLEKAYYFNARNKAVLLLESLQQEAAMARAGIPDSLRRQEAAARMQIARAEQEAYGAFQEGKPTDNLEQGLFRQYQDYERLLQQLKVRYPRYNSLSHTMSALPRVSGLQASLPPGQALVEYFAGDDSIYTFLITKQGFQLTALPLPSGFQDSIALFRSLLASEIEEECEKMFASVSYQLYRWLLAGPLASLQKEGEYNRLLIIPDGLLNLISFESLLYRPVQKIKGSEGFLIERYAFSYAYSSGLLTMPPSMGDPPPPLNFGGFGLEYDDQTLRYLQELKGEKSQNAPSWKAPCGKPDTARYLGRLAYSDDEVQNIAGLMGGDAWVNQEVTKRAFLQAAGKYRYLHMAMHGDYDMEFAMNSALIFTKESDTTDNFLRASEIYQMGLRCDMAVLSACNTAYGQLLRGEGVMSLARAFNYAGASAVVASLWSMPDHSTSEIMLLFYQYLRDGRPKDEALRLAKLEYLRNDALSSPSTRTPAHWAPAIVIGDIHPVSLSKGGQWLPFFYILAAAGLGALAFRAWLRQKMAGRPV